MVARLGGDEFVVLVRDANELSVVEKYCAFAGKNTAAIRVLRWF